jgi:hypothetical protein
MNAVNVWWVKAGLSGLCAALGACCLVAGMFGYAVHCALWAVVIWYLGEWICRLFSE